MLIFVLYDSISNSVFTGQVLQPLLQKTEQHPAILLVTFEKNKKTAQAIINTLTLPKNIKIHVIKKRSFLGRISLYSDAHKLKALLSRFEHYQLVARGPLAGWLCMRARNSETPLTVQARGLLAAEYRYTHNTKNWWHRFRARECEQIERAVYQSDTITIEAVSPALKDYLVDTFNANSAHITIAKDDIPPALSAEHKKRARTQLRAHLGISQSANVYCYNGSAKPWQCPEKVATFFKEKHRENSSVFLLVLTQDTQTFTDLLNQHIINPATYRVLTVDHNQIYDYLAACDYGILLRKPHIVNWTSRPTKALEYQAAGLKVIHNNTIQYLQNEALNGLKAVVSRGILRSQPYFAKASKGSTRH